MYLFNRNKCTKHNTSRLGHFWTPRVLGLPIALRVGADVCIPHSCRCGGRMDSRGLHGLMFVFLILAVAAGGWTVGVCMVCPADTVLAAFQGIRQ